MKILRKVEDMKTIAGPLVFAAGTLDGIHIGHQAVIGTAVEHASRKKGSAWVLTFEPHPRKVLGNGTESLLLTSLPHKLRLIEALSVEGCVLMPFERELRNLSPEDFIAILNEKIPGLAEIVVGEDWSFGKDGAGDVERLRGLAEQYGFAVTVVDPVAVDGEVVSSTRIREAVAQGDLDSARRMLGRHFSVLGTVVEGHKIGRKLGYPTANIAAGGEIEPPPGIYAVYAIINRKRHDGVAYYGSRPTFADERHELILEVHLFDGSFDLYSSEMEICFVAHIRSDRQFNSADELIAAIESDCRRARALLNTPVNRKQIS